MINIISNYQSLAKIWNEHQISGWKKDAYGATLTLQSARRGLEKALGKSAFTDNADNRAMVNRIRNLIASPVQQRNFQLFGYLMNAWDSILPHASPEFKRQFSIIKSVLAIRESGGILTFVGEGNGSNIWKGDVHHGLTNLVHPARFTTYIGFSGFGFAQWTGPRNTMLRKRTFAAALKGQDPDLLLIDPQWQALYFVLDFLSITRGFGSAILGDQAHAVFSKKMSDMINGTVKCEMGFIQGALMIWQAGGGFGVKSLAQRNALLYGVNGTPTKTNMGVWTRGIIGNDFYNAIRVGLKGLWLRTDTITPRSIRDGIVEGFDQGASSRKNVYKDAEHIHIILGRNKTTKKGYDIVSVGWNDNILEKLNLI